MVNNFKKKNDKPVLPYISEVAGGWQVNYAPSEGWRMIANKADAEQDLVNYIDYRVAKMAREMFELTRLKRKVMS